MACFEALNEVPRLKNYMYPSSEITMIGDKDNKAIFADVYV